MTPKLAVGDRVKIRTGKTSFIVTEVDVRGSGEPAHPSTYLVRIAPEFGKGPQLVYGNAGLDKQP